MNARELAEYRELVMTAERGAGRVQCWLCGRVFAAGEPVLCVPTNCGETEKMRRGAEYEYLPAHRTCLVRIP